MSIILSDVQDRIGLLEQKIGELSKGGAFVVPITTLAPEPYDLIKEIKVVLQPSDDEYVASFFDANVNASGGSEADALDSLKEMLISRFDYLENLPPEKLGPGPAKQLAVLRCFIRRTA